MATVYTELLPEGAQYLAANFPAYVKTNGTNFPVTALAFDAAATETAYWRMRAANYGGGNLVAEIEWYADSASSGDVVWEASIAAITPETDTQDIETKAFATAQTVTDSHLGTTGQREHRALLTISNLDSLADKDDLTLKFSRLGASGSDTMTGDALLVRVVLTWSDGT